MTYAELHEAIRVLGVGERASMKEIKARHRELVKRHHPDTGATGEMEMMRDVNFAYKIIQDYVSNYRFSFAESEFYEQSPEERIWQQFADDPLWGRK